MTNLEARESNQILLLASDLLGETLSKQLQEFELNVDIVLRDENLKRHPCLIIWNIENAEAISLLQLEIRRLQSRWHPSPLIVLLPPSSKLDPNELLQFDCSGILQDPDLQSLIEAIKTVRKGGRVVRLKEAQSRSDLQAPVAMGLGQWLLLSGLQQINYELGKIDLILKNSKHNSFEELYIHGQMRELRAAKEFLLWLWRPTDLSMLKKNNLNRDIKKIGINNNINETDLSTDIHLKGRDSLSVAEAIYQRINQSIKNGLVNSTGRLLAIEGLHNTRQAELLSALLTQYDLLFKRLLNEERNSYVLLERWMSLQKELREQSIRAMIGSYIRLPLNGVQTAVADQVVKAADLLVTDDELPNPSHMLEPLLDNSPVLVDGQLLSPDDPRSIIQLEMYITNWMIRTAELVSAEVIEACGEWPELRRYLLKPKLISTRELERLRNQLNSQNRWQSLIHLPIQLYESKRMFYRIKQGKIEPILITEPRDQELRQLGWLQQQVALLVEARDALAPQLQSLVKRLGDLMVVILTQIVGRAIGLVGRGIAQGMGRSLGRS